MAHVFVIAETESGAREACSVARSFCGNVVLCIAGAPAIPGIADTCVHIDVPEGHLVDDAYPAVIEAFKRSEASVVLAEQTVRTLSLVGRLAASCGAAALTGVSSFNDFEASSMYFGGAGVRVARPATDVAFYVLSAGAFDASAAAGSDVVEEVAFVAPEAAAKKTGSEEVPASDVNLASAEVIVSCGRGFAEEADLQLARDLAAKLGGECGCTRPLAEGVNWFPRDAYIGVSGAIVSPRVVVCAGVSGQAQHMVGLSGASTLIAINKDKNAPIFKQCDLGFVGDLKTVLPELTAAL